MLKHLTIYFPRGDGDSFVVRNIAGKHDDRKIVVSLLESDELTAGLLWQKKNTPAGGSDAEVLVTYDSVRKTSDFEITLLREDTEALVGSKYFLSLSSTAVDDLEDHETIVTADFVLQPSGESVMNGVIEEGEKFVPVKLSEVEDGYFVKRNGNTFDGQDLSSVISNSHVHSNKSIIDQVSQQTLDQNNLHAELFDYLLNGNIDEADTNVSIDFNKSLIRIGAL